MTAEKTVEKRARSEQGKRNEERRRQERRGGKKKRRYRVVQRRVKETREGTRYK